MTTHILPPVIDVTINSNIDVMRAGDAARRVATLVNFSPIYQGIVAGVAISLADWLCRTQEPHLIEIYAIQQGQEHGLRMACNIDWLQNKPATAVEEAMRVKLDNLIDDISLLHEPRPVLYLTMWLTPERQDRHRAKEVT